MRSSQRGSKNTKRASKAHAAKKQRDSKIRAQRNEPTLVTEAPGLIGSQALITVQNSFGTELRSGPEQARLELIRNPVDSLIPTNDYALLKQVKIELQTEPNEAQLKVLQEYDALDRQRRELMRQVREIKKK